MQRKKSNALTIWWNFSDARRLTDALYALDRDVREEISAKAIDAAADVMVGPMRAAAPVGKTGNLRASIARATRRYNTTTFGIVGPQYPRGAHGHLVERGSKQRTTAGRGPVIFQKANRGRMPKNPFIANTYSAHRGTMVSTLISVLTTEIENATSGG